jgi:hypothetical protein
MGRLGDTPLPQGFDERVFAWRFHKGRLAERSEESGAQRRFRESKGGWPQKIGPRVLAKMEGSFLSISRQAGLRLPFMVLLLIFSSNGFIAPHSTSCSFTHCVHPFVVVFGELSPFARLWLMNSGFDWVEDKK